eukprot:5060793-Karenia_brevis.AAC.1
MSSMLSEWIANQDLPNARCIRCVVWDNARAHEDKLTCISCQKTKTIVEFSIGAMNVWMARTGTWAHKWRCFE